MSEFGPWLRRAGLDRFDSRHGLPGEALICTFCGSLDPETLLTWMATGGRITPTDKSYKLYASIKGQREYKFYFQHFNDVQRTEFIAMYNLHERPFIMGYPGYFYVLPYFAGRRLQEME